MSTCTLRVSGTSFDVKKFLGNSAFDCIDVWEKGEPTIAVAQITNAAGAGSLTAGIASKIPSFKDSGFVAFLNETEDPTSIENLVNETAAFLKANHVSLISLSEDPSVESMEMQFTFFAPSGSDVNAPMAKMLFLPKEFIKQVASLGMSVEVAVYNAQMIGGAE